MFKSYKKRVEKTAKPLPTEKVNQPTKKPMSVLVRIKKTHVSPPGRSLQHVCRRLLRVYCHI